MELLQEAIHGLLEEKRGKQRQQGGEEEGAMDREEDLFLSSLLSKVSMSLLLCTCTSELFQVADAPFGPKIGLHLPRQLPGIHLHTTSSSVDTNRLHSFHFIIL